MGKIKGFLFAVRHREILMRFGFITTLAGREIELYRLFYLLTTVFSGATLTLSVTVGLVSSFVTYRFQ